MAYKQGITNSDVRDYLRGSKVFWAITANVGYSCPNNEEDVLLIQFFINAINTEVFGDAGDDLYIEEDGRFGGETWGAIKKFQKDLGCVADGMISAVKGDRLWSPRNSRAYTIYELNYVYMDFRRIFFHDLTMDPDLPRDLLDHIYVEPSEEDSD